MSRSSLFDTTSPIRARRPSIRRTAVTTSAVALSLLAAACTGSTGSVTGATSATAGSGTPTAATGVPSGSATSTAGAGGATTPAGGASSGSTGGSTAMCAESQLKASVDFQHPAGTINDRYHPVVVYFQNTSSTPCTISGYPGAAVVDAQGKQVVQATRTIRGNALGLPVGQDTVPVVTLQPGRYASAGLEGVSTKETGAAQAGCSTTTYPGILVTPPNTTIPVPFTVPWPYCYSFQVHPVNTADNPPS